MGSLQGNQLRGPRARSFSSLLRLRLFKFSSLGSFNLRLFKDIMRTLTVVLLLTALTCTSGQAGLCTWCPRVLPRWNATYSMVESTIVMPCNASGLLDPSLIAPYALSSFDWSNAKMLWANQHPMDSESLLVEQADAIRAISPNQRVWVYRNLVWAM